MLKAPRAVVAALLVGLVALPAVADVPVVSDGVRRAIRRPQAATQTDTGIDALTARNLGTDYSWDKTGKVKQASIWLPDEPIGPLQTMTQLAPALLMIVLAALGLTITFTSLRSDMKRRRVHYVPRGPRTAGGGPESD